MAISLGEDRGSRRNLKKAGAIAGSLLAAGLAATWFFSGSKPNFDSVCLQTTSLVPPNSTFYPSDRFLESDYVKYSAKVMGGAIKIPTETFDDMDLDVAAEDRFLIFKKLHAYLAEEFPLVNEYRETVNHYGLLYTIPGSDKTLKPIVLMAHQDVVPVNKETEDQWDHSPFSGYYDGEYIYGRGTSDTKSSLIAQLEAIEALLQQSWSPTRTVILSFGFDEEIEGYRGAQTLAAVIEKRYGKNGCEVIVDEGFGINDYHGTLFATPTVVEKGRIDFNMELLTHGGHSSMPPDHTGIGILGTLAHNLEADPFSPLIAEDSVLTEMFGCYGKYTEDISDKERNVLGNLDKKKYRTKLAEALESDVKTRFIVHTTQAVDVINGGVKVNALPEKTVMQVDHRIAIHQTMVDVKERLVKHVSNLAEAYDLTVEFEGEEIAQGNFGFLNITSFGNLDPSPVSSYNDHIWNIIAGTTKHVFEDVAPFVDAPVYVAPGLMTGNTDTAHYWGVSDHIYRYMPCYMEDMINFHTVNEKLRFRSHLTTLVWFYEYILHWTVEESN